MPRSLPSADGGKARLAADLASARRALSPAHWRDEAPYASDAEVIGRALVTLLAIDCFWEAVDSAAGPTACAARLVPKAGASRATMAQLVALARSGLVAARAAGHDERDLRDLAWANPVFLIMATGEERGHRPSGKYARGGQLQDGAAALARLLGGRCIVAGCSRSQPDHNGDGWRRGDQRCWWHRSSAEGRSDDAYLRWRAGLEAARAFLRAVDESLSRCRPVTE
ncbi:MAG TPA: hypothetical protein VF533_17470 [Solirubrobacteraceae bacterium]|jgi:hypothetical protein